MKWCFKAFKNYAKFEGRASRKEYWMFFLFDVIVRIMLILICGVIGYLIEGTLNGFGGGAIIGIVLIIYVYHWVMLVPHLAFGARRLHDSGHSGLLLLLLLAPIGIFVLIVFMCLDSEVKENKHGPNPKVALK
ncbi:DUF805 domain-containing protein [Bacillus sp. WMMC1349]|uniref:DUF805 domain-containing protein n=1 Tax=Bacillus sp. WMMC1349 TaxID=2736254 RepID=UPI0015524D50|nr:DUF805 domain-containing protein [Bacillus sp. WMMC1349]NPC92021.1 DUF805 domain-containing protein [Bacillus sp. WMMC1349]